MKKIMTLFGVLALSTATTFAFITETQNSEIDTLRSQGYSESTLRTVDAVKALNQGPTGKYKKVYTTKKTGAYRRVKLYIDPIQDDDKFGMHEINFTNSWNGDDTHYSTTKLQSENL